MNIRYTLRRARRSPVTTALTVVVLALGIGASTAIFSVLNNTLQDVPCDSSHARFHGHEEDS